MQSDFVARQCSITGKSSYRHFNGKSYYMPRILPDCVPLDYYLYRSMQYDFADQHFKAYKEIKNDSMNGLLRQIFYCGIHLLPEKWEKVIASDEQYF